MNFGMMNTQKYNAMKKECDWFLIWMILFFIGSSVPGFAAKPDSIQIVFDKDQLVLPGESFRIGVIAYQRNGKVKKTMGLAGGSTFWWKYKIDVTGGSFSSGKINVNERLIPSKGKYILVKASPRKQPGLAKEVLFPLNYETRITFQPENKFDKAPGSRIKGRLISEFDNGQSRVYDNLRREKDAGNFNFEGAGGYWQRGEFTINPDFTQIEGHRAELIINSTRNQAVMDTFSVLLDYKHDYRLSLWGESGMSGFSGSSGFDGSSGNYGGDGQPGQNGDFGQNAPDIGVWVDLYRDSILNTNLLYVYAENMWTGEEHRYLVNPDGGSLTVSSIGGSGGSGGDGGRGGNGGNGRDGEIWIERKVEKRIVKKPVKETVVRKVKKTITDSDGKTKEVEEDVVEQVEVMKDVEEEVVVEIRHQGPGEDGGDGGNGGPGGLGGAGGAGGNIELYFTDDAWGYQDLIRARSEGGSGGSNGNGGSGGSGGSGGQGNPSGRNGSSGYSGPSAFGWAPGGPSGGISIHPTEEFFFYRPVENK